MDPGGGEVGQVREFVLGGQPEYEALGGEAELAQRPVGGQHLAILWLVPAAGN